MEDLEHAIAAALNSVSAENPSNTPDFILAQYLLGCLEAWNAGVTAREKWYGRDKQVTGGSGPDPIAPKESGIGRKKHGGTKRIFRCQRES